MVKIENCDEDDTASVGTGSLRDGVMKQPDPTHASVKAEEEGQPSSSSSYLRSQFIGMGFSPVLVDKMLQKHGDHDSDTILESLLSHPNTGSESSNSLGSLFDSDNEENSSPLVSRREANQDVKPESDSSSERRSYLLSTMNFSQKEVDLAFNQLGAEAPLDELVDCIVTAQVAISSGGRENGHDECVYGFETRNYSLRSILTVAKMDVSDTEIRLDTSISVTVNMGRMEYILSSSERGFQHVLYQSDSEKEKSELLFGVMDKTLYLRQMGFTEEEVSSAIGSFGQETTVDELADSIFARRIANTIQQKQVKIESEFLGETETEYSTSHQRLRYYDDDDDNIRVKKARHTFRDDRGSSSSHVGNYPSPTPWLSGCAGLVGNGYLKEEDEMTSCPRANIRGNLAKPPYFLYGNLVDITKDAWGQLSGFLCSVQPEFVNSRLFSALTRREGYIHNLPTERRRVVAPKSPMTIVDTLPFTRQWWPSWDTRKQISSVTSDVAGVEQICEKLEKTIKDSRGILSKEKQAQIVHQCKMANLVWIGQDRLSPLQPNQLEQILGYPPDHTDLWNLNSQEKIMAMKYAFQTDTLAYMLSVLKDIYPDGLRVLSIYSGVGGAEVALHRLGIPLKCVVSVEESEVNRKILRRWWGKTQQTGELRQLSSIWKLKTNVLEDAMKDFGGFDLVIGGNYSSYSGGMTVNATLGMDSSKFFEHGL